MIINCPNWSDQSEKEIQFGLLRWIRCQKYLHPLKRISTEWISVKEEREREREKERERERERERGSETEGTDIQISCP